ncbi:MAG: hypothetical protein ABIP44_12200 [Pseudoxanthomonas sp.]
MRYRDLVVLLVPLPLILALGFLPAHADPRPTPGVSCTAGGLRSPPQFNQVSPGRAEYNFSGVCITREGQSLGYRIDGTWTPSEMGGNANASEAYRIDRLSGPSESFTAVVGWRCDADPWLHDTHCDRVGDNIPEEPYAFWEEFGRGSMPSSRRALSAEQRAALLADYERANGGRHFGKMSDRAGSDSTSYASPAPGTTRDRIPAARIAGEAALNPQPLPPEPDPDPTPAERTVPAATNPAERSIIIVGGKPATAPLRKSRVVKERGSD